MGVVIVAVIGPVVADAVWAGDRVGVVGIGAAGHPGGYLRRRCYTADVA